MEKKTCTALPTILRMEVDDLLPIVDASTLLRLRGG